MDDGLEKAIDSFNDAFYEIGKSIFEYASEMGDKMREALSGMDEFNQALSAIYKIIDDAIEKIKNRSAERKKWRRCSSVKIFTFLYDKRGKVHRCRNNC